MQDAEFNRIKDIKHNKQAEKNMVKDNPWMLDDWAIQTTKKLYPKKKKQHGGFYKGLDLEYITNWENIHKKRLDCCPCVFNLLGLDLDESNFMVGLYGDTGMKKEEIINYFSEKYPNYSFSFIKSSETLNRTIHKIPELWNNRSLRKTVKKSKHNSLVKGYQREVKRFLNDIQNLSRCLIFIAHRSVLINISISFVGFI